MYNPRPMEPFIQISKINDFLYSPKSLYLHSVYETFDQKTYHETPQVVGKLTHQNIEEHTYSTAKRYLQGMAVYSTKYNIGGKIDIYDQNTSTLIERKTKLKTLQTGHKYQLYAQMFCLQEMGYQVKKLAIHSLQDNKRYQISLPTPSEIKDFEQTLYAMRHYDPRQAQPTDFRCELSIYRHLSF